MEGSSLSSMSAEDNYAMGQEIAKTLPTDIQDILRRKSSRDPNSRFNRKLHCLLSYADAAGPEMAEQMGIGWIDDQIFHMYKPRLLGIMGLKLNSLNVNLRDLKFVQLQGDKRYQGWTTWRKDGFNKRSFAPASSYVSDETSMFQQSLTRLDSDNVEFEIGKIHEQELDILQQMILQEWQQITDSASVTSCAASYFIGRAANRYRQEKQTHRNAFDVLKAILAPLDVTEIKYSDFFRFMAMFGPGETVMLKIHSLLEIATRDVPWLYFGLAPSLDEAGVFGYFDVNEPNALILRQGQSVEKIWNLPLVPAQEGCQYIEDAAGKKYGSWQEYFGEHPVSYSQPFEVGDIGGFH